jgi:hypothetical protein
VDFLPTSDVLHRRPRLDYKVAVPVLGIATQFETNSRYVCDLVEETFGEWQSLGEDCDRSRSGVRVRILVHEGTEHGEGHAPVRHLCPDATRVIVHSPGSVAITNPSDREAIAYVTTALVADRAHFRSAVLEAITLALLAYFDRHPLHASAVASGSRAVILAASTGIGKSTLAYAAHSAGFAVLSEDRVWVQLDPVPRVWGWPGQARLLSEVANVFPEILERGTPRVYNGKQKLALDLPRGPTLSPYVVDKAIVCLLARGRRKPVLHRLSSAELIDALTHDVAVGFDRFPKRHEAVVRALSAGGGWRLTLSDDAREAVPLLQRILDAARDER